MQKINKSKLELRAAEETFKLLNEEQLQREGSIGAKKNQLNEEMETLIRQLSPIQKMEDEPHML